MKIYVYFRCDRFGMRFRVYVRTNSKTFFSVSIHISIIIFYIRSSLKEMNFMKNKNKNLTFGDISAKNWRDNTTIEAPLFDLIEHENRL